MNFLFQKADFKPNKLDGRFSLHERFSNDSVICLNLLSDEIEYFVCRIKKNEVYCEPLSKKLKYGNLSELAEILGDIHRECGIVHCSCTIDENFEIILLQKSLQRESHQKTLEYTPSMLGPAYEKDRKYCHIANPEFNKTLLFSFSRHHIHQLTDAINKGGFILAQLGCGVFNLLRYHVLEAKKTERNLDALLVIAQKCVVLLKLRGTDWVEVSFRHIYDEEISVASIIYPLVKRLDISGNIGYYCLFNEEEMDQLNDSTANVAYLNQGAFNENLLLMHNIHKK